MSANFLLTFGQSRITICFRRRTEGCYDRQTNIHAGFEFILWLGVLNDEQTG